jgi:hypothetical protein
VAAVLYVDVNRHVHEITPFGTGFRNLDTNLPPQSAPLASPAPAGGPVPDVIGYVRADNRTAMIYVDSNQHVIELLRNPGGNPPWVAYDLSVFANVQVEGTKRSAFPYARSDGYNAIVYVASDNHIHELAAFGTSGPGSGAWGDADLTAITGATPPSTDPWAYKRSDGYNSVVYIGTDSQMHELWLFPGGGWGHSILPAVSPRGGLWMRPSGFVRVDGVNAVFYVDDEGLVHELALLSGGWSDFVRSSDTDVAGQVFAHRATANLSSVVYQANDIEAVFHGFELRLPAGGNNWTFQQF